jgi:L-methionine (R)-S-oxide reductase
MKCWIRFQPAELSCELGARSLCSNWSVPVATYGELLEELERISSAAGSADELMRAMVERLRRIPAFNWVGFYMIEQGRAGEPEKMLVLGPFAGADTPHKRIPLNQGICGAAASSGDTIVVDDVHADSRYLACSIETKSEIVVPIRVRGEVVGELDIDSHTPSAFQRRERELVERCAELFGRFMEQHSAQSVGSSDMRAGQRG